MSKGPVNHTKKWVDLWLAAVSPWRSSIGRLAPLPCLITSPSCWGTHFLYLSKTPSRLQLFITNALTTSESTGLLHRQILVIWPCERSQTWKKFLFDLPEEFFRNLVCCCSAVEEGNEDVGESSFNVPKHVFWIQLKLHESFFCYNFFYLSQRHLWAQWGCPSEMFPLQETSWCWPAGSTFHIHWVLVLCHQW